MDLLFRVNTNHNKSPNFLMHYRLSTLPSHARKHTMKTFYFLSSALQFNVMMKRRWPTSFKWPDYFLYASTWGVYIQKFMPNVQYRIVFHLAREQKQF
jgi:hypothetical protein